MGETPPGKGVMGEMDLRSGGYGGNRSSIRGLWRMDLRSSGKAPPPTFVEKLVDLLYPFDQMTTTILHLTRDIWSIIFRDFGVSDLLCIRVTCKSLNTIVKKQNVFWYREHQWFLQQKGKISKMKSRTRVHSDVVHSWCVPETHPALPQGFRTTPYYQRMSIRHALVRDGAIDPNECCKNPRCQVWVGRNSKVAIPLGKHFKKHNCYLYWYLIERYRHITVRAKNSTRGKRNDLNYRKRKVRELETEIQEHRSKIRRLDVEIRDEIAVMKRNDVFDKVKRIDTYRGV